MKQLIDPGPVTYEEYLRIEAASTDVRHEYVGGFLHAMVGASRRHNRIIGGLYTRLNIARGDGPCEVYFETVKLRTAQGDVYYPDLVVTCDPTDTDPLVVYHPCLVVEVLSPSTTGTDLREKRVAYRAMPSVLAYLVFHQDEQRVERHWRDEPSGPWQVEWRAEGVVPVPCPQTEINIEDIYRNLPLA